ncbi:MAG: methylenetetrahydrofolate reductase [NAD(P)H] [Bdellovibrio sp.]
MKVVEHIQKATESLFSYEIVPPPRGRSVKDIIEVVKALAPLNPSWIDVTSHSSTTYFQEKLDGTIQKRTLRKRPGTLGICGIIQNRFKIDTVAHILCLGFTREETEDALIELNFLGIENILALRGDTPNFQKPARTDRTVNSYAAELVGQINDLKNGSFLDELDRADSLQFCIGVAGYPEKHFEASCLKADIQNLKRKVDAGADYIVTQMFFDNKKYFNFVEQCREAGINVPIIPGIKVLKSAAQLKSIPKNFFIDLPEQLVEEIESNPENAAEIGKRWCSKQVEELVNAKVPSVHFYVLNDVQTVVEIVKKFK